VRFYDHHQSCFELAKQMSEKKTLIHFWMTKNCTRSRLPVKYSTMNATAAAAFMDPAFQCYRKNVQTHHDACQREEDTKEVAGFLLSLKHRSVTPEPLDSVSESVQSHALAYPSLYNYAYGPASTSSDVPYISNRPYESEEPFVYNNRAPSLMDENAPGMTEMPWEMLLGDSKLVFLKDRDLVPDSLFVAMAQMKRCHLTDADRVGCYKSRELGFTGFCCKHCGGQPGFGKYFPASVRSLAQTTTSQTILKHIGSKCRFCPPHVRQAVVDLQRQQAIREGSSSGRPRYGSRKIFFQRIWGRLHGGTAQENAEDDDASHDTPSDIEEASATSDDHDEADELSSSSSSLKRKARSGILPTQKNKRTKGTDSNRSR
jgi:hypothetical protein